MAKLFCLIENLLFFFGVFFVLCMRWHFADDKLLTSVLTTGQLNLAMVTGNTAWFVDRCSCVVILFFFIKNSNIVNIIFIFLKMISYIKILFHGLLDFWKNILNHLFISNRQFGAIEHLWLICQEQRFSGTYSKKFT